MKDGRLEDAVASLMPLEKQTRLATDVKSTARILFSIVRCEPSLVFLPSDRPRAGRGAR